MTILGRAGIARILTVQIIGIAETNTKIIKTDVTANAIKSLIVTGVGNGATATIAGIGANGSSA